MEHSLLAGPSVYLETTIIGYLTSRPSRDLVVAARQELTRQWWEEERQNYRTDMPKDPIVEEIRAAREKIAADCDYDMHKLLEREQEILKRWKGKVVTQEEWFRDRAKRKPPK